MSSYKNCYKIIIGMKFFTLTFVPIALFIFSCGQSGKEKFINATQKAHYLLTKKKCDDALAITNKLYRSGNHSTNGDFLSLHASALACKGHYDDFGFFIDNLPILTNVSDTNFLYSTSNFNNATIAPSQKPYGHLKEAIDVLLYPGNLTTSSHSQRAELLGEKMAHNINSQILFMVITQLGRYTRHYGNMGILNGRIIKGEGDHANNCFIDYTTAVAQTAKSAILQNNPCIDNDDGHLDMKENAPDRIKIICEGVTMMNIALDLIGRTLTLIDTSERLNELKNLTLNRCRLSGEIDENSSVCSVQTPKKCEELSIEELELYMLIHFEILTGN